MRIAYYVRITAADTNSIYWVFVATVRDLLEFMIIYYIPYISSLNERGKDTHMAVFTYLKIGSRIWHAKLTKMS